MRFICDEMFGSLARWLRMIGEDTLYLRDVDDDEIIRVAREEGRFLLTRDKELHRRYPYSMYIDENDLDRQLAKVIEELGLRVDREKGRCTLCNGELDIVEREEVAGRVPKYTYLSHDHFYRCRECGKIYWKGSHWERIRDGLESVQENGRFS
ncbi:MAG: uncharacterized protein PWQ88_1058 [Candidatus Methanomethylophilaceae archaeon]|nr:uncharacterized protein [Candidatus Methanomethylophilaceae archaeon]MDI3541329.1 uncharacterized protein [Candidatus Methanomethylophilaceae archaeon]HIJ00374.1 DUF5615 family PIN-like protein [Candidatus Methanomethylophilaceae archaeon]